MKNSNEIKIHLKIYLLGDLIKTVDDKVNEIWWLDNSCEWLNTQLLNVAKKDNIAFDELKYDMELSNK